jgi:flagella basal body P-ring formation protein FlgA
VIKNADPVNIIYSSGSINLKTSGIALRAGAVGDMIKVKNGTSGIVVLGKIINNNTVQVSGDNHE